MQAQRQDSGRFERVEPYLQPAQVKDLVEERAAITEVLSAPPHISNAVQDRGAMRKHAQHIERSLHHDAPKPYAGEEVDKAKERESELLDRIVAGMPTQAEMRRNPPGAVDKHRNWERRHKADLMEWKNIRRRLLVGGHIDGPVDATDVSNIERYRPAGGAQELSMDNAQIAGRAYFMPAGMPAVQNLMDPAEADEDRRLRTELQAKLDAEKRNQQGGGKGK